MLQATFLEIIKSHGRAKFNPIYKGNKEAENIS